jgi:dihydrofolate synthase/folylpolyglutamate synthase
MDIQQAHTYIDTIQKQGNVLGRKLLRKLLENLGSPQEKLPIVHVAGTNGKGSTIAFLEEILRQAGYKTGRYVSPTVFGYLERFQINGVWMPEETFAELVTELAPYVEQVNADYRAEGGAGNAEQEQIEKPVDAVSVGPHGGLTAYEIETAMAFLYFQRENCDIVLLETGLGGMEDATNVASHVLCSVITAIGLDHTRILGDTIGKIASVKAGIIKPGCPVVVSGENQEGDKQAALEAILAYADKQKAPVVVTAPHRIRDYTAEPEKQYFSYETKEGTVYRHLTISLNGRFQLNNCINALEVIEILRKKGYNISNEQIEKALPLTCWQGRISKLGERPDFYVDGAHNPDAVRVLRDFVETYFKEKKIIFIIGVLGDKAYDKMLKTIVPLADFVIATQPDNPRSMPATELAEVISKLGVRVERAASVAEGVEIALEMAKQWSQQDSVIFAFGSLYYLGDVKAAYEQQEEQR